MITKTVIYKVSNMSTERVTYGYVKFLAQGRFTLIVVRGLHAPLSFLTTIAGHGDPALQCVVRS